MKTVFIKVTIFNWYTLTYNDFTNYFCLLYLRKRIEIKKARQLHLQLTRLLFYLTLNLSLTPNL